MVRTLIRLPNWLGDIVMALPAVHALRGWRGVGTLALAAPAALVGVARMIEGIDQVVPLASTGRSRGTAWDEDVARIASGRFDRVILLTNSFGSAWMVRRAGVPQRWGYRADWRGLLLTRAVSRRASTDRESDRHHARYYLRLVERLGIGVPPGDPAASARLSVEPRVRSAARQLLHSRGIGEGVVVVGFAPGAAYGQAKRWLPEHVAAVVGGLAADGVASAVVGAPSDADTGRAIESAIEALGPGFRRPGVVNLIGETDLPMLAAVLAECRAVVSNDSGAMHVAAAVGTPVVAVFGPTDQRATAPLGVHTIVTADVFCRPCHLRTCPIDHRCMRRVPARQVLDAVRLHLAGARSAS